MLDKIYVTHRHTRGMTLPLLHPMLALGGWGATQYQCLTHTHTPRARALAHTSEELKQEDWGAGLKAGRGRDRKAR